MSKSRKILSVVVALMMVVASFAVTASAAYYYESDDEVANYTQAWALSEPVDNGDGTWSVDVSLTTNYATGAIQFVVTNTNTAAADVKSVALGNAIPDDYNAEISEKDGKIIIVPSTAGVDTITGVAINGVIAKIVYTYSGTGSATIAIENNAKSKINPNGSLIATRVTDDDVVNGDMITGQTVTSTGASRVIGDAAVAPELAVIDGTIGVINTDKTEYSAGTCDGYIYGVEPESGEAVNDVFEVIGDGTMNIVANGSGSDAGTGTIVEVLDSSDTVVATYVLIIFGDVNGDGAVDATDAADLEVHDNYMYGIDPDTYDDLLGFEGRLPMEAEFAGDINNDGAADGTDAAELETHDNYMFGINPDSYEDIYGIEGRIKQSYVINLL